MSDPRIVYIPVCEQCIRGEGEHCNNPACSFCRCPTPEVGPQGKVYLDIMELRQDKGQLWEGEIQVASSLAYIWHQYEAHKKELEIKTQRVEALETAYATHTEQLEERDMRIERLGADKRRLKYENDALAANVTRLTSKLQALGEELP